jgi:hypothetical protein
MTKLLRNLFRRRPTSGESTGPQGAVQTAFGVSQVPGFAPPLPGTYAVYRRMSAHPTLALAKSIVTAPILAGSWGMEMRRPDGAKVRRPTIGDGVQTDPLDRQLADRSRFIQSQLQPLRTGFLVEAMRALEFGWAPFEKVWNVQNGTVTLQRLKPLLADFTFVQVDGHGDFAGLEQMDVQLEPHKAFVYTHDGQAGNIYGRSRHENARHVWWNWNQVDERTAQLTTKIAAIIPMVHYPLGQSRDANGVVRDNSELADVVLAGLGSGRGVKLPNLFANSEDPRISATLAGQSAWVIGFLEASSAAQNLQGMIARQQYYDALMFRAWLRPERTGLESKFGSRADSQQHTDNSITDSELIHFDVCEQLNRSVVDDLLAFNFGPQAVGSVYVVPMPLQDQKRAVLTELLTKLWSNPALLAQFIEQTDMDAVFDVMEVPKGQRPIGFGARIGQKP